MSIPTCGRNARQAKISLAECTEARTSKRSAHLSHRTRGPIPDGQNLVTVIFSAARCASRISVDDWNSLGGELAKELDAVSANIDHFLELKDHSLDLELRLKVQDGAGHYDIGIIPRD